MTEASGAAAGADRLVVPYVPRLLLGLPPGHGPLAHQVDGSLLFVDVAGFTALSERLAARGRSGAEEVTDLLDATFDRMLSSAYAHGGSLMFFGGDALCVLFTDDDHVRRAARTAALVRRAPAEIGALQTSVGKVRLSVSQGLHTGRLTLLLGGEGYRLPILCGPTTSGTLALEKVADAGEVAVSPEVAAALDPRETTTPPGRPLQLARVPRAPREPTPGAAFVQRSAAAAYLDPGVVEHVRTAQGSEHRRIAVSFVRFSGLDGLLATAGPQAAAEAVHEVVSVTQRAARDYGVTVLASDVDVDAGRLLLVAGAPVASDRPVDRLLLTTRAAVAVDGPLRMTAGVTTGPVFAGDVGPAFRRTYATIGDQVNLAARLMAAAHPGQVLASPDAIAATRTRWQVTVLDPISVKGKSRPIAPQLVGPEDTSATTTVRAAPRQGTLPLVGRETEVATLTGLLDGAVEGRGQVVEVVGDAGGGKTRLLLEVLERHVAAHPQTRLLRVAVEPYEQSSAYALTRRVLRGALGLALDTDPATVRAALVEQVPGGDQPLLALAAHADDGTSGAEADEHLSARVGRAVSAALPRLLPGPTAVVVEDLHWADTASLDVLRWVGRDLPQRPWCLLATRRPSGAPLVDPPAVEGVTLALGPLDDRAAADLVHRAAGDLALPERRAEALVARAGGNPLFLAELLGAALTGGAEEDLPATVEGVLAARVDALDPPRRRLLRDASVLGPAFDLDLLTAVQPGLATADDALWQSLAGLLERDGERVSFGHALLRDAAYEGLPHRRRRQLHGEVGTELERRGAEPELLALHFAGAQEHARTWTYAVAAGDRARARGSSAEAAAFYRSALDAHARGGVGPAHETAEVQHRLALALDRSGDQQAALLALRRARRLSPRGTQGDPTLLRREALVRAGLGRYADAVRWAKRGLAALRPGDDPVEAVELRIAIAETQFRTGRYRASLRWLEEAIALAEAHDVPGSLAHAHYAAHLVLTTMGSPRRVEHRAQALPLYERLGDVAGQARVLNNLGIDAYYEGRWDDAIAYYDRSTACEDLDGNVVGSAISVSNTAEVLSDQGHLDEAEVRLQRALRAFRAARFPIGEMIVRSHLGRLETRRGRWDQAEEQLDAAVAGFEAIGAAGMVPEVQVRRAELRLCQHLPAGDLLDAVRDAMDTGDLRSTWHRLDAVRRVQAGEHDGAVAALDQALAAADRTARYPRALAHRALSQVLDDPAAAARHARRSRTLLLGLGVVALRTPLDGDRLVSVS